MLLCPSIRWLLLADGLRTTLDLADERGMSHAGRTNPTISSAFFSSVEQEELDPSARTVDLDFEQVRLLLVLRVDDSFLCKNDTQLFTSTNDHHHGVTLHPAEHLKGQDPHNCKKDNNISLCSRQMILMKDRRLVAAAMLVRVMLCDCCMRTPQQDGDIIHCHLTTPLPRSRVQPQLMSASSI
jgi:hypothetical protein